MAHRWIIQMFSIEKQDNTVQKCAAAVQECTGTIAANMKPHI